MLRYWIIVSILLLGCNIWAQDTLTITYCDGGEQVVSLDQSKEKIESMAFTCASGGFGHSTYIPGALQGSIYFLPSGTSRLPDFSLMEPVGVIYATQLDVPPQSFDKGFPGITDRFEWFGIRYEGSFEVVAQGSYEFRIVSDDGSRVYIDDKLIIDNDGQHPPRSRSAAIDLTRGQHAIRVDYYQGPRVTVALQLFIKPPGGTEEVFNSTSP